MIIHHKHFKQRPMRPANRPSVFHLIYQLLQFCLALFTTKPPQNRNAHLRKWEQEKMIKFGLTSTSPHRKATFIKPVQTNAWEKEKMASFGLSLPGAHKNIPRADNYLKKVREEKNIAREMLYRNKPAKSFSIQHTSPNDFFAT